MLPSILFLAVVSSTSGCAVLSEPVTELQPAISSRESFESGTVIGGRLDLESLWIAPGSVVWVESDLDLRVSEVVRIEGLLVAFDAAPLGFLDAPNIRITSPLAIDVIGEIRGGRGLDAASGRGGNGSAIQLSAPLVLIDGEVRAGDGGRGGAGASGGDGGDANVEGYFNVRVSDERRFTLRGGRGGDGGFPGGDGGWGGAAIAHVTESFAIAYLENSKSISEALADFSALGASSTALSCPAGGNGGDGGNSQSGDGGNGVQGADGTQSSPIGKKGGDGRASRDATGGDATSGKNGSDCCPDTGGSGGSGGKGGSAQSGKGGSGGKGGRGYNTAQDQGGDGGNAGDSGSAKGGKSGDGGNGGRHLGAAGAAGSAGSVTVGSPGTPGLGGEGSPGGAAGAPGSPGTQTQSSIGATGSQGGPCPQQN